MYISGMSFTAWRPTQHWPHKTGCDTPQSDDWDVSLKCTNGKTQMTRQKYEKRQAGVSSFHSLWCPTEFMGLSYMVRYYTHFSTISDVNEVIWIKTWAMKHDLCIFFFFMGFCCKTHKRNKLIQYALSKNELSFLTLWSALHSSPRICQH